MTASRMLHGNATAHHLALLRIWVFGWWIAQVLKDPITEVAPLPFSNFISIGILRFLPVSFWSAIHTETALRLWWGMLLVFLFLSMLGTPFYRIIATITCILLTFYQGMIFAFSEVTHAPLAALYTTYVLAMFPSADALSLRRPRSPWTAKPVYQAALWAASACLLATYMFTGVRRLFASGIEIFTNGTILSMIAERSSAADHLQQNYALRLLESPTITLLLQVGFVLLTLMEILSLLCLSSTWFRRLWLAVMLPFHVLSWPLLQLLFVFNMLLIWVLLIDWDGIARWVGVQRWFGALGREDKPQIT